MVTVGAARVRGGVRGVGMGEGGGGAGRGGMRVGGAPPRPTRVRVRGGRADRELQRAGAAWGG